MEHVFSIAVLCYLLLLTGLWIFHTLMPRRNGFLALAQVFAPYLFLLALAVLPFALAVANDNLRAALFVCSVIYGVRFACLTWRRRFPENHHVIHLSVMTWNVLRTNLHLRAIVGLVKSAQVQVVALQELIPQHVDALERDQVITRCYPHRLLVGRSDDTGIGLLSTYPILEYGTLDAPSTIWSRLDLGAGLTVTIVNAHPTLLNPRFSNFDTRHRDNGIAQVRKLIVPMLQRRERVLLVGDFNVTERELAYKDLTADLEDAFRYTRFGTGNTWRSERFLWLGFGLLRLDYLFCSPGLTPLATSIDCTRHGSDHCSMQGTFGIVR